MNVTQLNTFLLVNKWYLNIKNETDAEMYVVLDEEKRLVGSDIYGVDAALI